MCVPSIFATFRELEGQVGSAMAPCSKFESCSLGFLCQLSSYLLLFPSRLYTRHNYEKDMNEFEPGEISRIPLDNIILLLKGMLAEEGVTKVLLNTLEPPNTSTIDRSFQSLFRSHFISAPEDDCEITTLGHFVSSLGIDLALGSVIGLGIQFGVGPEAIELAGVLSFPKTPWIMTSPLIHEPKEYNGMLK